MVDLVSIVSAVGGSGLFIVTRDLWLSRRTVKSAEKVEKRNAAREPLIVESILLGNTAKVAELFKEGMTELEDSRRRLAEELRETKGRLEEQVSALTTENVRMKQAREAEKEESERKIAELYAEIGKLKFGKNVDN